MTTINDVIYKSTMLAMSQGSLQERKRIWNLINLDMMIPMTAKRKIRDMIFGVDSDEPILENR